MSILVESAPARKPITVAPASLTPWDEHAGEWVDPLTLPFGTRLTLRELPGVHRVVRAAEMGNDGHFRVRVRELADNGSMVGPVRSVRPREVTAIVTDARVQEVADPVAVPAEAPAAVAVAVETADRPLDVAMVISINGQHYAVAVLAPAPAAVKAYRFTKIGGDGSQHDIDQGPHGASCTCGDFVWRHEGRDDLGCRHIRAARMLGLIAEAPEPSHKYDDVTLVDAPDPRDAYNDHREKLAALEAAEAEVRREGEAANHAQDIVLIDDDGTPLETPREMDERHRAEHAALVAEVLEGRPSLPACCPDDSPMPCTACVHEGPADLSDTDGWDDSHVWAPTDFAPDDDEPFASWLDGQAEAFATIGTRRASWLAGKIAGLAAQARWLDAACPDAFDDRLDAALDADAARIEARHAAALGR